MNLFFIIITTLAMPSHPTPTNRPKVVQRFLEPFSIVEPELLPNFWIGSGSVKRNRKAVAYYRLSSKHIINGFAHCKVLKEYQGVSKM